MEEFSISVTIAERPYKLTIAKNEEETVRKAAKLINEKIKDFSKSYAFKDYQDLLAMIALQFTTQFLNLDKQINTKDLKIIEKLTDIDNMLAEMDKNNVL